MLWSSLPKPCAVDIFKHRRTFLALLLYNKPFDFASFPINHIFLLPSLNIVYLTFYVLSQILLRYCNVRKMHWIATL